MAATEGQVVTIGDLIYIVADQQVLTINPGDWMIDVNVQPYVLEQWDGQSQLNATHKKVFVTTDDDIAFTKVENVISPEETEVTFDPVSDIDRIPEDFIAEYFKGDFEDPTCPECGEREFKCLIDTVDVETIDCVVTITVLTYHT